MSTLREQICATATTTKNPLNAGKIQIGLNIDEEQRKEISATIKREMENFSILGCSLSRDSTKQKLQTIFKDVTTRFAPVFNHTPEAFNELCLTKLAQLCNYNCKRRKEEKSVPRQEQEYTQRQGSVFGITPICVERKEEAGTKAIILLPSHLIAVEKDYVDITIDDISYDRFVKVLTEDIAYTAATESISYKFGGREAFQIEPDRTLRSAMAEIHDSNASTDRLLRFHIHTSRLEQPIPVVDSGSGSGSGHLPTEQQRQKCCCAKQNGPTKHINESITINLPSDCRISTRTAGCDGSEAAPCVADADKSLKPGEANGQRKRKASPAATDTARKGKRKQGSSLQDSEVGSVD